MADFKTALALTDANEGGYMFDEDDPGGETYRGIARKKEPDWGGWPIIDDIKSNQDSSLPPLEQQLIDNSLLNESADQFYKRKYWDAIKLDECPDQDIANELYDTGVNQGVRRASKYLQRSLNLLNRMEHDYPDVKIDGYVGSATIAVLKQALSKGYRWKVGIIKCLNGEQYMRYRIITLLLKGFEKYFHGWLTRITFNIGGQNGE